MSLENSGSTIGSEIPQFVSYIVTSLLSIALYNVIELTVLIFFTFNRRKGLYFWSLLIATWGIASYAVGFILKDFNLANSISYFYVTLIVFGWCAMVTGQSLVLFSRLHLIVRKRAILNLVLGMIILNVIILHIPTVVLCYGANSSQYKRFNIPYAVYERIQVTIFFVQELTISCLYVYETCRLLHTGGRLNDMHGVAGRTLLLHLIYVSIIVVLLDTAIIVLQFTGRYASQTAAKGFIYSVKLKLEFDILNRLVKLARRSSDSNSGFGYGYGSRYACSIDQLGDIQGSDDGAVRRRWSCPWNIFAIKVKHEIFGPAENGTRHGSQLVIA
ncbi:hypothetical protein PHISCL_07145 [Aspergillus sclerotialis]|uniref:DUF7703 domain-containing protein n=1 Tax=Aspergillus sclerotialis TaxID=2070753 RepID=A0A3A2ZMC2_9EURO|nr:hypothetical protein PHISCL_07145 [Aspergillus sclerotialis]